jgi:hypothetical protein
MASVEPIKPADDDRQVLRLDADAAQILVESLLIEWETQAEESAREVNQSIGNLERREMYASDAAWKAKRQCVIVEMLEQLGVVA